MKKMKFFSPETDEEKETIIKELTSKSAAFGIDLGTTNSAISVIPRGTAPIIIPLKDNRTTIPSCVMWDSSTDTFIVGKDAYKQRYKSNCIYSVKRLMQDANATVTLMDNGNEKIMTPAEVSAEILKGLIAETGGVYGDIKDVVITVPAKFNEIGRKNTKKAAELAGLNLLGIISEPTAASMCYELKPKDGGSRDLLVYDLGGGTFDISLVRITGEVDFSSFENLYGIPNELSVKKKETTIRALDGDGDIHLGGDDIDLEIYNNFLKQLKAKGVDISLITREESHKVILLIEQLKKGNPRDISTLKIKVGNEVHSVSLSYAEFKAGLLPTYNKTKKLINQVLQRNRTNADSIVLVGGSTKNPILKELLSEDYPEYEINDAFPADESVALGAGIHSRFLKFKDNNINVFDSLVDGIGVCNESRVSTIIPRGSQFPVTKCKLYETIEDNQESIEVEIVQGNTNIAVEACKLGTLLIDNLPKGKKGDIEIRIQLSIDVRGLLKCAVDIRDITKHEEPLHRELELKLSAGNASGGTKLSKDEKLKFRWTNFANKLSGQNKEELLRLIDAYPDNATADVIQARIKELM